MTIAKKISVRATLALLVSMCTFPAHAQVEKIPGVNDERAGVTCTRHAYNKTKDLKMWVWLEPRNGESQAMWNTEIRNSRTYVVAPNSHAAIKYPGGFYQIRMAYERVGDGAFRFQYVADIHAAFGSCPKIPVKGKGSTKWFSVNEPADGDVTLGG